MTIRHSVAFALLVAMMGCAQARQPAPAVGQAANQTDLGSSLYWSSLDPLVWPFLISNIPVPGLSTPSWYLMIPPLAGHGWDVDTEVPLSKWQVINSLEIWDQCEDLRLAGRREAQHKYRENLSHPKDADEAEAARRSNAVCVEIDDPRLKAE